MFVSVCVGEDHAGDPINSINPLPAVISIVSCLTPEFRYNLLRVVTLLGYFSCLGCTGLHVYDAPVVRFENYVTGLRVSCAKCVF